MNYVDRLCEQIEIEQASPQAICKRCSEPFAYIPPKRGSRRWYCDGCRRLNAREAEKLCRDKRLSPTFGSFVRTLAAPPAKPTSRIAWTDTRVTELRALIREGLSAKLISLKLGGISRCAVIGKAHRLGLKVGTERAPRPKPAPRAKPNPRPALLDRAALHELPPDHSDCAVLFMDIQPYQCRYPVSPEGEPFLFCAAPSWHPGASYCPRHHVVCHKPAGRAA